MMIDHPNAIEWDGMFHYFTPECDEHRWRADPMFCARPTTNGAIGTCGDMWVHVVPGMRGQTVKLPRQRLIEAQGMEHAP